MFVVGLVSLSRKVFAFGLQKKFLRLSQVRMVAETVLGRKFEPISTRVEWWGSLTRLPCAYIIHSSVVKSKTT